MATEEQSNLYLLGIAQIEGYYQTHNITHTTAKHAYVYELFDTVLNSRISVPGYKYNSPRPDKDFLIEFKHKDEYVKISYSDIALDVYQKVRYYPDLLMPMLKFILYIGIQGESTAIPEKLMRMKAIPPKAELVTYIDSNMEKHRLNPLKFGIPIEYYPKILFWLGINEEINYAPKVYNGWGGRRTTVKRLVEIIYIAEIANGRSDKKIKPVDKENLLLVFKRIRDGKNPDFEDLPLFYKKIFAIIDTYKHAT